MNSFNQCLEYSMGDREKFDISLLLPYFKDGTKIIKTDTQTDKLGVDYIAREPDGNEVYIDAKTRQRNACRYWVDNEPELALEVYSVVETKTRGWLTKNSAIHPHYILFTFHPEDTKKFYMIPYILLRKSAKIYGGEWIKHYPIKYQNNVGLNGMRYTSSAMFVPARVVLSAVRGIMEGTA